LPKPMTMPIENEKSRRPERTEAIRILKPAISNIPTRVSATVAAHANDTVDELGKRDVTAPVYSPKRAKFPQDTFFAPYGPNKPKRSATADRKEAPSANRANRRTTSVPFSVSCAAFEFIRASTSESGTSKWVCVLPLGAGMRSSVNSNVFAVHHRCRLQVEQRVHDFRDLDQSRNRAEFFEGLVVAVSVHRRVHDARRDPVGPNPLGHVFHRQGAAERGDGGFGDDRQCVVPTGQGLIDHNGRNAHDVAGLLFAHLRHRLLCHEEVSSNINADVRFKILRRIFREWLGNIDSRIVDEQVNASEMAHGRLSHL